MHRRTLLSGASAALAGLSIPGWTQTFVSPPATPRERTTILRAALSAARLRGRPLLVLVGDSDKGSDAARRWTYFLDRGAPSDLADLALCDLVCSVRDDLAPTFGADLGEFPSDTMAILIGADNQEFVQIASAGTVPENRFVEFEADPTQLVVHNSAVARALHACISPDRLTLVRRAASTRKALSADELRQLNGAEAQSPEALGTLARLAPAELALRELDDPKSSPSLVYALANEVILRWRVGRPPGARWATRGAGCSPDRLEGSPDSKENVGSPCGTGFMSLYSKRFMWFYAEHERRTFEDAPQH